MVFISLKSILVQHTNLHMSKKGSTFAPDFKIYLERKINTFF